MTDAAQNPEELDPEYHHHGGFPEYGPASPGPGFGRFVAAMRRLQDLAVSADPGDGVWDPPGDDAGRSAARGGAGVWDPPGDDAGRSAARGGAGVWDEAADRAEALVELLGPFQADEGKAPAGRTPGLPGMGSLLLPPWTLTRYGPDGVAMTGYFSRFHVGGNMAVHGGVLPLLFDHIFGMISHAAGRPISRTAFLHVDYRKITPIDAPLAIRGRVTRTEGRKAFVSGELVDADETLLAEGNGLMVRLMPGQP